MMLRGEKKSKLLRVREEPALGCTRRDRTPHLSRAYVKEATNAGLAHYKTIQMEALGDPHHLVVDGGRLFVLACRRDWMNEWVVQVFDTTSFAHFKVITEEEEGGEERGIVSSASSSSLPHSSAATRLLDAMRMGRLRMACRGLLLRLRSFG